MPPITPLLLIAVPQMEDPNFAKSVVLIIHHDPNGALGLILNDPLEVTLGAFAESQSIPCHTALRNQPVFRGGPVEPERGWIFHEDAETAEKQEVLPNLFLSGTGETLTRFLTEGIRPFRLILGYAGWGEGQLEKEMREGAWIVAKASSKYVFQVETGAIWRTVLADLGVDPNRLMIGSGLH